VFGPTFFALSEAAKLVLNALTTREEGSAAATSAAFELSGDVTRESKVWKLSGLVISMAVLASLWEHGWQPADLVHAVRRLSADIPIGVRTGSHVALLWAARRRLPQLFRRPAGSCARG
jgi:hypothetical protein